MSNPNQGFLRGLWNEYCRCCSIYAVRHLNANVHIAERTWWFSWIFAGILACVLAMVTLHGKWNQSPVVISYGRKLLPVWAIPFPAITVCPLSRVQVKFFNSTDVFVRLHGENISDDEYLRLRALLHFCPYMTGFYEYNDSLAVNYVDILDQIAIPFVDMFSTCSFRKYSLDCSAIFSRSLTEIGICYTFNAVDAEDLLRTDNLQRDYLYSNAYYDGSINWTLQDGYVNPFDLYAYPLRPVGGGLTTALVLVLRTIKKDIDYFCEGAVNGYKIVIHSPDERPSFQSIFYRLPHHSVLTINVQPELTYISRDLRKHPYTRRQCYFSGERYLRYYKIYNRNNCLDECISNITFRECGCVGIASPRSPDMSVCDGADLFCPRIFLNRFLERSDLDTILRMPCGCLPACTTLSYNVEISNLPWNFEAFGRATGASTEKYDYLDPAVLVVAYKYKWFLPLKRQELFGVVDMLAKFGGLFGLVMGASLISLLELVYYCVIRPWRNDYPEANVPQVLPWVD
ncbi:pickpocket protein 28-like [Armigeres subalbatus]|uniref:pickpocket protein 28-like n=1 Tax=Armigeres subalbatus TaxID=124917 RepID=UPI002ED5EC9B